MQDLHDITSRTPDFPRLAFVHMGDEIQCSDFLDELFPDAECISDPQGLLYRAHGLQQGTLWQMFSPQVWLAGLRGVSKGHFIGMPMGDPLQMPGYFLLQDGEVIWSYRPKHAGDHPDLESLPAAA